MPTININKAPVPQVVDFLKNRVDELPAKDRQFAYSLLGAAAGRGLSDKQATWVRKMADRILHPVAVPEPTEIGDISGLVTLFAKASASGLKWPKLNAVTEDGTVLTLRVAGEKSQHVGQIMVSSGKREERVYFGRVDLAGVFHPSMQPTPEALAQAKPALIAMATDPAAAGKAYGQRTGNCAFCSLPLEDGRSVEAGYGPVCAEKWGLPWGLSRLRRGYGTAFQTVPANPEPPAKRVRKARRK